MSVDRERVQLILDEVLELPREEWSTRLEIACAGDEALRHEVESLLGHAPAPGVDGRSGLDTHAHPMRNDIDGGTVAPTDASSLYLGFRHGDRIDHFRIVEHLGEGGFGDVYLAEQMTPVRRRVALKVIKPGMDTRAVVARFNAERQVLALMEHPGIARAYEAGATRDGRPFFVMEYVDGESVTDYCDSHRLDANQRLRLFALICDAVQYAHQKGVIHRDLKPSNMLVCDGENGSDPAVRIIDFGIAKATGEVHPAETALTQAGQLLGTPDYMSPEQTVQDAAEVDTRADIYSLGVTLYEILTGVLPFEDTTLRMGGLPHIQRLVRDFVPIRPSRRLSSIDPDQRQRIADARGVNPAALRSMLRRELEWIPLKAMRKDPEERYATVADLGADVRRYLAGEALLAGPETGAYRFRKLARRHRGPVAAGLVVLLVLMIGLATTMIFAVRSSSNARIAMQRAQELQEVVDFQSQQLAEVDPELMAIRLREDLIESARSSLSQGQLPPVEVEPHLDDFVQALGRMNLTDVALKSLRRTLFEPTLEAIHAQFQDQPLVRAQLLQVFADTTRELGIVDLATVPQEQALHIRREYLGNDHPFTLESIAHLGSLLQVKGQYVDAEPYHREALEGYEREFGEEHPGTFAAKQRMGTLLSDQGEHEKAERYLSDALAGFRQLLGDEHTETFSAMSSMGSLCRNQGRYEEAEIYSKGALEGRRRVLGYDHRLTLKSTHHVGVVLVSQGKYSEAERYHQEALSGLRRAMGDLHPDTLGATNDMGHLLQLQGRYAEAEQYCREALQGYRHVLGDDHLRTMESINGMGRLLQEQGKYLEAKPYFQEALERRRRVLGDDHPHTLAAVNNMGGIFVNLGEFDQTQKHWTEALEGYRRVLGNEHPLTLTTINNMGGLLKAQGRHTEAEPYLEEALEVRRRVLGEDHPHTLFSIRNMGGLLRDQGKYAQAEPFVRDAHAGFQRVLGEGHHETLRSVIDLSALLVAQERFDEAATESENWLPAMREALGNEHPHTLNAIGLAARIRRGVGDLSGSVMLFRELMETLRSLDRDPGRLAGRTIADLVDVLQELEEYEEAMTRALEWEAHAREFYGSDHEETSNAVDLLVELYQERHAADPAGGHDAEVERWRKQQVQRIAAYEAGEASSEDP